MKISEKKLTKLKTKLEKKKHGKRLNTKTKTRKHKISNFFNITKNLKLLNIRN